MPSLRVHRRVKDYPGAVVEEVREYWTSRRGRVLVLCVVDGAEMWFYINELEVR